MDGLGEKIRSERLKKSLTLKQLSEQAKISISFLSELERGIAQPSMASLRKISQALDISLLSFQEIDSAPDGVSALQPLYRAQAPSTRYITEETVVRAGQRKKIAYPGRSGFYELLTPDLNRQLEVLYVRMDPGFDSGAGQIADPPGEKCLVVLTGSMDFKVAGREYHLDKGDSISYPADSPVSWRTSDEGVVEAMLIITPPGF